MFPLLLLTSFLLRIYGNDGMESMSKEQVHPECRIINLSEPDSSMCSSFNCHVDGIPTKLFIPQECAKITEILNGKTVLWRGESCSFLMIHYERNKPMFIVVTNECFDGITHTIYYNNKGKWVRCESYNDLPCLNPTANKFVELAVEIEWTTDDQKCKVFDTLLYTYPAKLFVPNPGYHAHEVWCGTERIWGSNTYRCILLTLILYGEDPFAMYLVVRNNQNRSDNLYFTRDGIFGSTTAREYYSKIMLMKETICKTPKWSNCV